MSVRRLLLIFGVVVAGGMVGGSEGGDEPHKTCQDTHAIQWFTPGRFAAARARAEEEQRFLMIKGIAFGVDEEGAKCATKGCW